MDHNYDNDPNFIPNLESFMGIKENFENYSDKHKNLDHLDINVFHVDVSNIPDNVVVLGGWKGYADFHPEECVAPLMDIKDIYYRNHSSPSYYGKENINIAIHVRKANTHDTRPTELTDKSYIKFINHVLREEKISENFQLHIYSQTPINQVFDFEVYTEIYKDKVVFHLDKTIEETFNGFVHADILVSASSSFSHIAGFLCNNLVYMHPFLFIHKPLPHWKLLPKYET